MEVPERSSPKILVVDDESYNIELLDFILQKEGYETDSASGGLIALEKARTEQFSLILLDLVMPEMDGYEVIKILKQDPVTRDIPVIFISANMDESSYIKGIELGALDYFRKPYNRYELVLKIRNYYKIRELESDLKDELKERKKIEEQLIHSESRYRSIIEDQTEFVVRHLPDGTLTFINAAYGNYVRSTPEKLVGTNFFTRIPEDMRQEIRTAIQLLTPKNSVKSDDYRGKLPSGESFWQSWTHRALFDADGGLKEIQSVGRDVTEMKAAEQSIRVISEMTAGLTGTQFFDTLVSNIVDILNVDYAFIGESHEDRPGIISITSVSRKEKVFDTLEFELQNTPGTEVFGKKIRIYPKEIRKLFPIDPMLRDLNIESYAGIPLFGKNKMPIGILVVLHSRPLGKLELLKTQLMAFSVRAAAELERLKSEQAIIKNEKRLELALSVSGSGVYEYTYPLFSDTYFSQRWTRILGFRKLDMPSGKQFLPWYFKQIHREDRSRVEKSYSDFIGGVNMEFSQEYRVQRQSKKWIYIQDICRAIERDDQEQAKRVIGIMHDITYRKRDEEELRESKEHFQKIFMTSPEIIAIFRYSDWKFFEVNDVFTRVLGYTRKDCIGYSMFDLGLWVDIEHGEEVEAQMKKNGFLDGFDCQVTTKMGEIIHIQISATLIYLEGEPHVLAVAANIENLKKIQNSLQESETKYRLLADYNYDWEYWMDSDQNYIYVSPSCERITGYTANEFIARPELLLEIVHPDFLDEIRNHFTESHDLGYHEIDFKIIDKQGEEKWLNHHCLPVHDHQGNYLGRRGNNRDITEQKRVTNAILESEANFRNIFQHSSEGILISSPDRKILEVNDSLVKISGYTAIEIGKLQVKDLVAEDYIEKVNSRLKTLLKSGSAPSEKIKMVAKDGKHIPVEINSRLIDYSGQGAILTMIRDITEQEEIQNKIFNTIVETEEKERSRFANDLHDGLGPLLSTTKLYIKALATLVDPTQKEIAITNSQVAIDEAIASIRELSNNISPHVLRNFGLAAALKSYVQKVNGTNEISVLFQSEMKNRPEGNIELSLFRVVIELLNNTLKYARAKNATIILKGDNEPIYLSYMDDGQGFDTKKLLKNPKGRGLQNIVNRVKSLNGKIQFSSTKGEGMQVKIEI
ncbi:MAG: PAS domain S-box protein [Bacteroidetes bacterium]|nr:PAS domain S-box protein [Bacteroidota bacterium]